MQQVYGPFATEEETVKAKNIYYEVEDNCHQLGAFELKEGDKAEEYFTELVEEQQRIKAFREAFRQQSFKPT